MRLVLSRGAVAFESLPRGLDLSELARLPGVSWRSRGRTLRTGAARAARLLDALAQRGVRPADDEVRDAVDRAVRVDPLVAAQGAAALGDPRAIPALSRALDAYEPSADCAVCDYLAVAALAEAIEVLGGAPSPDQRAKVGEYHERQRGLWTPGPGLDADLPEVSALATTFVDGQAPGREPAVSGRRDRRPGRNDPCPCGSGEKYKRCHLDVDASALPVSSSRH